MMKINESDLYHFFNSNEQFVFNFYHSILGYQMKIQNLTMYKTVYVTGENEKKYLCGNQSVRKAEVEFALAITQHWIRIDQVHLGIT